MEIIEPNESDMLEALGRSGYLLESQISKILSSAGFFIQTNQMIKDPISGKNREVDLIAEYDNFKPRQSENRCFSKIHFVFEIKNTSAPLVLLTNFEYSPRIEDWFGLKERITIPKGVKYDTYDAFYEHIIKKDKFSIFTQYCSFQKKKANEELMALHPDNIHEGLSKITQYCEEQIGERFYENDKFDYLRHFIYLPILLIRDDLFELHYDDDNVSLKRVESSILVYNYLKDELPEMAYVFVVTKKGFGQFMQKMLDVENKIELEMIEKRQNGIASKYESKQSTRNSKE